MFLNELKLAYEKRHENVQKTLKEHILEAVLSGKKELVFTFEQDEYGRLVLDACNDILPSYYSTNKWFTHEIDGFLNVTRLTIDLNKLMAYCQDGKFVSLTNVDREEERKRPILKII